MEGKDTSLEKGIIEWTLPGNRKRRPGTAWIDNVTSWTGLKLEEASEKWTTDLHERRRFIVQPTLGSRTAKDKTRHMAHASYYNN